MSFKTKALGLVAAAALSLSICSGAMAADEVSVDGTAELGEGTCSAFITSGDATFGSWTYNGATNQYEAPTDGSNVANITGMVNEAEPGGSCDVTVQFSGLSDGTNNIGLGNFTANVDSAGYTAIPAGVATGQAFTVAGGAHNVDLSLNSVPSDYATGTYSGTLAITNVAAA